MRLKQYIKYHAWFLLFAAAFALYGVIAVYLLPPDYYHCFMHDILHLYCPLCGGTRAFLACLRFDFGLAFTLNPAVMLAAFFFLAFDLRALILILRRRKGALLPSFFLPLAVIWFTAYTVLRNALLLFGVDPIGDLAPFWAEHLTAASRVLSTLGMMLVGALLIAALFFPRKRYRPTAAWLCGALTVSTLALLLGKALLLLLLLPLAGAFLLTAYLSKRKKAA